jgi:hypothetical protein
VAHQPTDPHIPGKANFDDIYVAPDPRLYYRSLGELDYVVPHHGQKVFQQVLENSCRWPATTLRLQAMSRARAASEPHGMAAGFTFDIHGRVGQVPRRLPAGFCTDRTGAVRGEGDGTNIMGGGNVVWRRAGKPGRRHR